MCLFVYFVAYRVAISVCLSVFANSCVVLLQKQHRRSDPWPISGPEELPSVGDPLEETQPQHHRYYQSLQTMIPFRFPSG